MSSAEKEPPRNPSRDDARRAGARSAAPNRLGKYELIARIGKGGMAQVYLARQRGPANFEKVVVVKTIHPHLAAKESFIEMLLDEARIAALLKHPCVVDIYELGLEEDTYFIAMEYLSGEPLLSVLRAGRVENRSLDVHGTARILADVADGLHAAHELRDNAGHHLELVHRDITPGNIVVLYSGQVKIVDFGIAKARGRLASETDARKLKGKLGYVSPEQIRGESADRRADIFSLGVVMWEALTYRRLFRGSNPASVLANIVKERLYPPSSVRPEVPPDLDVICMRALARHPDERYATAQEMQADLEAFLAGAGASLQRKSIAGYMETVFAAQIRERARILREMHEGSSTAGPKDATAAFAMPPAMGDDDEDSGGKRRDTVNDVASDARPGNGGQEAAPAPAPANALPAPVASAPGHDLAVPAASTSGHDLAAMSRATPGHGLAAVSRATPGHGLAAVPVTPPSLLPMVPAGEFDGRVSSLTIGSSGELAVMLPPVDAYASAMLRRRRWRLAGVLGGAVGLLVVLVVLQEPAGPGDGHLSERLFAAGGEPAPVAEPALAASDPVAVTPVVATAEPGSTARAATQAPDPNLAQELAPAATEGTGISDEGLEIHADAEEARPSSNRRRVGRRAEATTARSKQDAAASAPAPTPTARAAVAQKRAEALYQEGVGLFVKGELGAAQLKFREALELAPGYAPAYRAMGMVHQQSGRRKQAARAYREYLRLAPRARDRAEIEARLSQVGG